MPFGTDEIDCIALISGEVVMFELKDKEFSVGNAYSFSAKISTIRPKHSVIITTDKVASDVKERFSRIEHGSRHTPFEESGRIHYVEGDDFVSGIRRVADEIYRSDAGNVLEEILLDSVLDARSLLRATASVSEPASPSAIASRKAKPRAK